MQLVGEDFDLDVHAGFAGVLIELETFTKQGFVAAYLNVGRRQAA